MANRWSILKDQTKPFGMAMLVQRPRLVVSNAEEKERMVAMFPIMTIPDS